MRPWFSLMLLALVLGARAQPPLASADDNELKEAAVPSEGVALKIEFPAWQMQRWKTAQGLPGNWIECVLQTSDGYLWLGTPDGLYRFDGLRFITLNRENCRAFESDVVKALVEDRDRALWVATKKGVLRLKDRIVRHFSKADGLGGAETTSLSVGPDGAVWVGTSGGVSRYHDGRWKTFTDPALPRAFVYSVLADSEGRVWVGTDIGLRRLDPDTGRFSAIWETSWPPPKPEGGVVRCLLRDRQGRIWFGTDHTVFRYAGGQLENWRLGRSSVEHRVKELFEDSAGRIWAIIGYALHRFEDGRFVSVDREYELADAVVNGIGEDREGNLWVATRYAGLTCLHPTPLQVFTQSDGLPDNRVVSIAPRREGGVYIVTQEGICVWNHGRLEEVRLPGSGPGAALRSVFEDPGGRLWLTSGTGGFQPLDSAMDGSAKESSQLMPGNDIRAAHRDRHGDLWLACRGALVRWIPAGEGQDGSAGIQGEMWLLNAKGIFRTLRGSNRYWNRSTDGVWSCTYQGISREFDPQAPPEGDRLGWIAETPDGTFPDFSFTTIAEDGAGALWFGTEQGGLVRLQDWKLTSFTVDDGLAANPVTALLVDSEGLLWVGSDAALSVRREGHFLSLDSTRGFPPDQVQQLVEDGDGNLWVGGDRGIYRLNRVQFLARAALGVAPFEVLALDEADGLLSTEVQGKVQPGACRTDDGRLWFPTAQGGVVIDPREARSSTTPPVLTVQRLRCAGDVVFDQDRYVAPPEGASSQGLPVRRAPARPSAARLLPGELRLPPGSGRYVEIAYSALALTTPEKLRFKYRLEGHDETWIDAGKRRVAYYTNLKPGAYRFRVIGGAPYGAWDEAGATLAFTLLPTFTETPWFYGLCVLGMATMLLTVHRVRLNVVRRLQQLRHETALAAEKTRIARDMHDDLGARLHEIILLSDASRQAKPVATPTTDPIVAAAREAARHLEEIVWAVQPGRDTLDNLLGFLVHRGSEILKCAGIRFQIEIPETIPPWPLDGPRRQNLFLICREALHNAVLHGRPDTIRLTVRLDDAQIQLSIRDDGRGFDPNKVDDSGNGLENMRQRAVEARAALKIESGPGQGTTVTIEWGRE